MSFSKKRIDVIFELATGAFSGGGNGHVASGLRVSCSIQVFGGAQQSIARLAIYGMPLETMNQLSNVGAKWGQAVRNNISILAGDEVSGMNLVFQGQIVTAMVDARAMPQVAFLVEAMPGYFGKINPTQPVSIRGSADVSGMMSQIASGLGMSFENNGVTAKLANPYYAGTLVQQATQIARDAGIVWIMDRGTLAIMNPGEPRQGQNVLISRETGMLSYPMFNQHEVIVQAAYNPAVKYGGNVDIQSDLTAANGTWIVRTLTYDLESEMPGGKWFMTIVGYIAGQTVAGG